MTIAIAIAAGLAAASGVAQAALEERDLLVAGDKLITFDTVTGLEWLDLTATNAQSYDAVAAGFGGYTTVHGFSFATTTQVHELYENAGLTNHSCFDTPGNVAPIQQLFALMGCTNNCSSNDPYSVGYGDLSPFSATYAGEAILAVHIASNLAEGCVLEYNALAKDTSQFDVASYLVRAQPVPVPYVSAPGILVIAILQVSAGVVAIRRRRFGMTDAGI